MYNQARQRELCDSVNFFIIINNQNIPLALIFIIELLMTIFIEENQLVVIVFR